MEKQRQERQDAEDEERRKAAEKVRLVHMKEHRERSLESKRNKIERHFKGPAGPEYRAQQADTDRIRMEEEMAHRGAFTKKPADIEEGEPDIFTPANQSKQAGKAPQAKNKGKGKAGRRGEEDSSTLRDIEATDFRSFA